MTTHLDYSVFPNPFNGKVTIRFSLEQRSEVVVEVFDLTSISVKKLFHGEVAPQKSYSIDFDMSDLPGGVYFYRIRIENNSITDRMVNLKDATLSMMPETQIHNTQ